MIYGPNGDVISQPPRWGYPVPKSEEKPQEEKK